MCSKVVIFPIFDFQILNLCEFWLIEKKNQILMSDELSVGKLLLM